MSTEADKVDQEIAGEVLNQILGALNVNPIRAVANGLEGFILAAIQKSKAPIEAAFALEMQGHLSAVKRVQDLVARLKLFERGDEAVNELLEKAGLSKRVDYGFLRGGRHFGITERVSTLVAQLAEAEKERDAYKVAHADKMEELVRTLEIKASLVAACKAKDEALKMFRDNRLGAYDACCRALAIQPDSSAPKKADLGEKDA